MLNQKDCDNFLCSLKLAIYICSVCGEIIFPAVTVDADGAINVETSSCNLLGGVGNRVLKKHICPTARRDSVYDERHFIAIATSHRGMYIAIASWCNQPGIFRKTSFREFCNARAERKRYMESFEAEYPEIAQRYFDFKWQ